MLMQSEEKKSHTYTYIHAHICKFEYTVSERKAFRWLDIFKVQFVVVSFELYTVINCGSYKKIHSGLAVSINRTKVILIRVWNVTRNL